MCGATEVLHDDAIRRERVPAREGPARGRVDHHRGVHVVESAGAKQRHLAAAAFFRRRPDGGDGSGQRLDDLAHRDRRGGADERDEVVPAAMPEIRERVVLGQDRDAWSVARAFRIGAV